MCALVQPAAGGVGGRAGGRCFPRAGGRCFPYVYFHPALIIISVPPSFLPSLPPTPPQLVKGMYSEFLGEWLAAFPRDQLLFLRNEDYKVRGGRGG